MSYSTRTALLTGEQQVRWAALLRRRSTRLADFQHRRRQTEGYLVTGVIFVAGSVVSPLMGLLPDAASLVGLPVGAYFLWLAYRSGRAQQPPPDPSETDPALAYERELRSRAASERTRSE